MSTRIKHNTENEVRNGAHSVHKPPRNCLQTFRARIAKYICT
jgi:hypothetical protein